MMFASLEAKTKAKHMLWYFDPTVVQRHGPDVIQRLQAKEWVFSLKCTIHGAHNGAKYGTKTHSTKETNDNAHITIKSCLNSF